MWASDIFPCLHQETDWPPPPKKKFFLLILWNFCLPKVKYRVLNSDIYSRYLRVPASGISSYPATAVLLAIEFKLNTRMTKIFLCPCIAIFNINTQALSYQHFSRQMSSINGVFKKYLFSSSQFACYLLHFEKHYRIQQLKHWNQIGVLIVSVKIIFQEAFIPSLLWKFTLIRSLTEPWKFVINCNEFVAYFFLYKRHLLLCLRAAVVLTALVSKRSRSPSLKCSVVSTQWLQHRFLSLGIMLMSYLI